MKKGSRLELLVRLARREERAAAIALAERRQALRHARLQSTQIATFRGEYQRRFVAAGHGGLSGAMAKSQQAFIAQLSNGVDNASVGIGEAERRMLEAESRWRARHVRLRALEKARERESREQRAVAARRERNRLDEFAQRGARRSGWLLED